MASRSEVEPSSRDGPEHHKDLFVPDDILLSILVSVRDVDGAWRGADIRAATQVCRRWRAAALAYPALWTKITVTRLTQREHVQLAFDRSARMPVDLAIRDTIRDTDPIYAVLISHAHRVRSLVLQERDVAHIPGRRVLRPMLQLIEATVHLQQFTLVGGFIGGDWDRGVIDAHPALRALSLVDCFLPWHLSHDAIAGTPYRRLGHFHVSFPTPHLSGSVHWPDMIRYLSRMPLLRTLELSDTPLAGSLEPVEVAPVALARLELFSASEVHPDIVRTLLAALKLPHTVRIHVVRDGNVPPRAELEELSRLSSHMSED